MIARPSSTEETPGADLPPQAPDDSPGAAPPLISPRLKFLLLTLGWLYVAYVFGRYGIFKPIVTAGIDFPKHWLAPRAILEGRNAYEGEGLWLFFNYPQWSALVTFWLGWLDARTAEVVWKMMNVGMVVVSWALIVRFLRPSPAVLAAPPNLANPQRLAVSTGVIRYWPLLTAVIVAAFSPATTTVFFTGNIEPWNVLAMTGFIVCLASGRFRLAGVCWAALCLIKMMPGILLLPLLLWRRWRVVQGWLLFLLAYLVVLILTGRIRYEWFFLTEVAPLVPFRWRGISVSIPQFALEYFLPAWNEDPAAYTRIANGWLFAVAVLYAALVMLFWRRRLPFERVLEPAILLIPFLSPLLEGHHFAWSLPVLFLQINRWLRGDLTNSFALVYAIGWMVVGLDYFYINLLHNFGRWTDYVVTVGGILLAATSATEHLRERPLPSDRNASDTYSAFKAA